MPFKSEKQRKWMWANDPEMAKKWEKEEKMKKETKVKKLIRKMVGEIMKEDFAGAYPEHQRKKFDNKRRKQSEVLGYKLTGTPDVKTEIGDATIKEAKKRDYKAEYKKFQSSTKSKKYRAELNKYNRQKGTYGNGDGLDASHKNGKIVGFEEQSKNRGRAEKSRLKKEGKLTEDFKNNEWEVYVADENRREKIVKVAKSKRAAVILYNKLIKTDKYHEVGMRVIKEGKLTEKVKYKKDKKIGGEWYTKQGTHKAQAKANILAKREFGRYYDTKVVKEKGGYTIYVKPLKEGKLTEANKSLPPFEISKRMMKSKYWKKVGPNFYKQVIKKFRGRGVTPKSLDKWLPDYIEGREISKLFEGNIGITTKKGKTIELTHKTSGKEIVVVNNSSVLKKYKKLGYLISMPEGKLTEKMDRKKAAVLLKQLGGNRFIAMTGAKGFAFSSKYMSFKIGRNSKGINFVRIGHNAKDLYDMEFGFVSVKGIKVKKKVKDVYADMLGTIFTKYTGMNVRL